MRGKRNVSVCSGHELTNALYAEHLFYELRGECDLEDRLFEISCMKVGSTAAFCRFYWLGEQLSSASSESPVQVISYPYSFRSFPS